MALGLFEQKKALEDAGFASVSEMQEFQKAIESNPSVNALSRSISNDSSINDDTQKKFLTALGKKWKDDRTVFSKLETDLKTGPELATAVKVTLNAAPQTMLEAIGQYTGGDLGAMMPAKGSYPEAEKRYASAPNKPSSMDVAAAAVTPRPQTQDEKDIETVQIMATEFAKNAVTKFGVSQSTANGFAKTIQQNPALALSISKNLKGQPKLLEAMASQTNAGLSNNPAIAQAQKAEMNKIMANPQLLANGEYTLRLQQKLEMAEDMKTGNYNKMFSAEMGRFREAISGMGPILAGFSGSLPVISMSRGSGLFPTLMVNLGNFEENAQNGRALSRYSNSDMTALSVAKNGSFYHDGKPIMGPDGKQTLDEKGKPKFEQVPNGQLTVKTVDGKEVKVIPAGGELMAKQRAGHYEGGKFVEGTIRVPVVTAIDEDGKTKSFQNIDMTPAEFKKYKEQVDALAASQGRPGLQFQNFTEQDAKAQGIVPTTQVVKVDPQSGATQNVTLQNGATPRVAQPVQPGSRDPAANERDMSLQA